MSKLVFELPNAQTPGYLRRMKKGLEFRAIRAQGVSPESIDEMVNYLLEYITEPKDREEAKETLYDATEDQYNEMIDALTGATETENPTVAETPLASSEPLEKVEKE